MPLDNNPQNISTAMSASGARFCNLAFVLDPGGCAPAWNGDAAHRVSIVDIEAELEGRLKAAKEAGGFIWGVVLQFPFYAGIFGIIQYSGLQDVIAGWFVAIATPQTYPAIIYWYSGILNYFVPSGGSKWAIEAPYIMTAGKTLGVSPQLTVIAYAWGDMVTDVIQPFWAIPLMGVAKLGFRDIMGYCMVYFLVYMVIISLGFWFLPYMFPY